MVKGGEVLLGDDLLARPAGRSTSASLWPRPARSITRSGASADDDRAGNARAARGDAVRRPAPRCPGKSPPGCRSPGAAPRSRPGARPTRRHDAGLRRERRGHARPSRSRERRPREEDLSLDSDTFESRPAPGCEMARTAAKLGLTDRIHGESSSTHRRTPRPEPLRETSLHSKSRGPRPEVRGIGEMKHGGIGIRMAEQFPARASPSSSPRARTTRTRVRTERLALRPSLSRTP